MAVPFLENTILFERYEVRAYVDVAAKARECCRAVVSDFAAKAPYIRAVDVLREDGVTWVRQVPIERLAADFVTPEGMVQLFALASAHESSNAAFAAMHLDGRYWCMAREEWVLREDYQREQQRRGRMGGLTGRSAELAGTDGSLTMAERGTIGGLIGGERSAALAGTGDRPSMSERGANGGERSAATAGTGDVPSMSERAAVAHTARSDMNPQLLAADDLRGALRELRSTYQRARLAGVSRADFKRAAGSGLERGNREPLSSRERQGRGSSKIVSPEDVAVDKWGCVDIRRTWGVSLHKYRRLALAFRCIATELERLAADAGANGESSNDDDDDDDDDDQGAGRGAGAARRGGGRRTPVPPSPEVTIGPTIPAPPLPPSPEVTIGPTIPAPPPQAPRRPRPRARGRGRRLGGGNQPGRGRGQRQLTLGDFWPPPPENQVEADEALARAIHASLADVPPPPDRPSTPPSLPVPAPVPASPRPAPLPAVPSRAPSPLPRWSRPEKRDRP